MQADVAWLYAEWAGMKQSCVFVCLFAQLAARSIKSLAPCLYREKTKKEKLLTISAKRKLVWLIRRQQQYESLPLN